MLLDGPAIPTLLSLLSHENTDIAADTVELLAEMTGAGEEEGLEGAVCRRLFPMDSRLWKGIDPTPAQDKHVCEHARHIVSKERGAGWAETGALLGHPAWPRRWKRSHPAKVVG